MALIITLALTLSACTGGSTPPVPGGTTPPPPATVPPPIAPPANPPVSPPAPPAASETITIANASLVALPNATGGWTVATPKNGSVIIDLRGSGPVGYLLVCELERSGVRSLSISAWRWSRATFDTFRSAFSGLTIDCRSFTPPTPPIAPPLVSWVTSVTGLVGNQRATVFYGASPVLLTSTAATNTTMMPQGGSGMASALYYDTTDQTTPVAIDRKSFSFASAGSLAFDRKAAKPFSSVGLVVSPAQVAGTTRTWLEYALQVAPPPSIGSFLLLGSGTALPSRVPTVPAALLQPNEVHTLVVSEVAPVNAAEQVKYSSVSTSFSGGRDLQLMLPSCDATVSRSAGLIAGSGEISTTGTYTGLTISGTQSSPTRTVYYSVSLEAISSFDPIVWSALPGWNSNWRFESGDVTAAIYLSKSSRADGGPATFTPRDGDSGSTCGLTQPLR